MIQIYTDGSCLRNPNGPGGYGVVVLEGGKVRDEYFEGYNDTTNNRMELLACIRALEMLQEKTPAEIFTDSQYVQKGITEWITSWKRNNWMRGPRKNEPVKNQDLWKRLDTLRVGKNVEWKWVKGHSTNTWNNRADELAVFAAKSGSRKKDREGLVEKLQNTLF